MFSIDNRGNITITKGDTAFILLSINDGTFDAIHEYELQPNDVITLYILNINEKDINKSFVIKEFDLSDICIVQNEEGQFQGQYIYMLITPQDTQCLNYREYSYIIKLFTNGGQNVDTIGPRRYFYVED